MIPALILLFSAIIPFFLLPFTLYSTRVQPSLPGDAYARPVLLTASLTATATPPPVTTISATTISATIVPAETFEISDIAYSASDTKDVIRYVPPHYDATDFYSVLAPGLAILAVILVIFVPRRLAGPIDSPASSPHHTTPHPSSPTAPTSDWRELPTPESPLLPKSKEDSPTERHFFKGALCSTPLEIRRCVDPSNDHSDSTVAFGLNKTIASSIPDSSSDSEVSPKPFSSRPAISEEEPTGQLSPSALFNLINSGLSQPSITVTPPGPSSPPAIPTTLGYQDWLRFDDSSDLPAPLALEHMNFQPIIEGEMLSPKALFDKACDECYQSFLLVSGYHREPLATYDPIIRFADETSNTDTVFGFPIRPLLRPASTINESLSGVFSVPEHSICSPSPPSPSPSPPPKPSQIQPVPSAARAAGTKPFQSRLRQPTRRPLAITLIMGRLAGPPSKLPQPTPRPAWVNAMVERYGTLDRPLYPSPRVPRRVVRKTGSALKRRVA